MPYHLTGRFIECCNCKVVCPCWVDDTPTEDHCAGFFAWTFADGSQIDGRDVDGRHVVVVTVHSDPTRGGSSESVIFVDDRLDPVPAAALMNAFAMGDPDRADALAELSGVLGYPVARTAARIEVDEVEQSAEQAAEAESGLGKRAVRRLRRARYPRTGFRVSVSVPSSTGTGREDLVATTLYPETFDDSTEPLTLNETALDKEMGVRRGVVAHRTETLLLRVSALAGGGTPLNGRSGMVGEFLYDDPSDALQPPRVSDSRRRGRGADETRV